MTVKSSIMHFLVISDAYIFGNFAAKTNITVRRRKVIYRLSMK